MEDKPPIENNENQIDEELDDSIKFKEDLDDKEKKNNSIHSKQYDKILKENFSEVIIPYLEKRYNFNLEHTMEIETSIQHTNEREPDFLRIVKSPDSKEYILHVEFQFNNSKDLLYRMKLYDAFLQAKYKLPVRSLVLYFAQSSIRTPHRLEEEMVFTGYEPIFFSDIPYTSFLETNSPPIIALGILGNPNNDTNQEKTKALMYKLKQLCDDELSLSKHLKQLQIMSQIRNLDEIVYKILKEMPISLDLSQNAAVKPLIEKYKRQIEAERQKVEAERQKVEAEKQKAEAEKQKAEAEKLRLESAIINSYKSGQSVQEIAMIFSLSEKEVEKRIKK